MPPQTATPLVAGAPLPFNVAQLVHDAISAALPRVVAASLATNAAAPVGPWTPMTARRSLWRRLLYLDVVLPLILVVVVIIVLLAWVG